MRVSRPSVRDLGICMCGCPKVWHTPKTTRRPCELCACRAYEPWVGAGVAK